MPTYPTNSWRTREALVERKPFRTHGALRAEEWPGRYADPGLLPGEWRSRWERDAINRQVAYAVFSYQTPIAWVLADGTVVKVDHKWSVTTSRHQGMLYALDASRETRAGIYEAAQRERQTARDRAAERREARLTVQYSRLADQQEARASYLAEAGDIPWSNAMRSAPEDYDRLIGEVQGMLIR